MNIRRHAIAGAVTAIPALLIIGSFAAPSGRTISAYAASAPNADAQATPSPTPTCLAAPTPTPLPGLPTVVPTSNPSTPPPTQSSGAGPTNSGGTGPAPGPSSGSTGAAGNPTGVGGGTGTSTPAGAGTPTTDPQSWPQTVSGHLVVADPLLASQVDLVLQHPVAQQRPDLLHFSLDGSPVSVVLAGLIGGGGPGGPAAVLDAPAPVLPSTAGAILLAGMLVGLIALAVHAQWRRLSTMLVVAPAVLAIPLSAAAAVLVTQPAPKAAATAITADSSAAQAPAITLGSLRAHALAVAAPSIVAPWSSLVGIENSLTSQHDAVAGNEQQIAKITQMLQQPPAALGGGPRGYRPNAYTLLTNRLKHLLASHETLVASYQASLQGEYDFFLATAQSPARLASLQTVVSHAPAAVQKAVTYDLTVVQTQLAQQAAINTALAQTPAVAQGPVLRGPVNMHAPLSGVVTQGFGPTSFSLEPPVTYHGTFYPHFHTGLDIAAPLDTPVGASADGVVILATQSRDAAGNLVGYGNYVVIRHANGLVTLYGHMDRLLVTAGQVVTQGQVIGLCGSTGWSTGPHVHFEIRLDGVYMDPAAFISKQIRQ